MYVFRAPTTPGTAYKFRYKVVDGAGNESDWKEGADVYKLDTVNPKVENINVSDYKEYEDGYKVDSF